ncbi:MAG: hypothetical protein ABMB14_38350 [Myxococcota bacterium]
MMDRSGVFSVHDVVEHLDQLHGTSVRVAGVLQLAFESDALWHMPASERVDSLPYRSGLWVHLDDAVRSLGEAVLHQFEGRRVIVTGVIDAQDAGHMGLWPAAILVSSIAKS